MTMRDRFRRICAFVIGAMTAIVVFAAPPANAQSGPFSALAGSWSGGGKINFSDGSSDRLRCRATYAVGGGGSSAQLTLRCASDSYNFNLSSNITSQGGAVSGTWSESNSWHRRNPVGPSEWQYTAATGAGRGLRGRIEHVGQREPSGRLDCGAGITDQGRDDRAHPRLIIGGAEITAACADR